MTFEAQTKPRRLSTCHRHPAEPVTGFCGSCLRERLAFLDSPAHPELSLSTAAESVILRTSGCGGGAELPIDRRQASVASSSAAEPDLRRCKSYSARKCGAPSGVSAPRRKSCDVRVRNTLSNLFKLDDEDDGPDRRIEVESKKLGFSGVGESGFELGGDAKHVDKFRVSEDRLPQNVDNNEKSFEEVDGEVKTMKEHIELDWQSSKHTGRDFKDIAGSFWVATSVFSQKLRKWRLKQGTKKHCNGDGGCGVGNVLQAQKLNGRRIRETQSEVGEYGLGRRSCDTEPRFSVDAGRISLDDPRFSFDEPRASWDGYMIARTIPRLAPMLSVIENAMMPPINRIEQMNSIIEDETNSVSSPQTRDYCSESSSSQRQNSFDCSSSGKSSSKQRLAVENDDMKSMSHTKVSLTADDVLHKTKIVVTGRDASHLNFNSLDYDYSKSSKSAHKDATLVYNKNEFKKTQRWGKVLKVLGFAGKLTNTQYGEVEGNEISHPIGDCCKRQIEEPNGVAKEASSRKLVRSVSCSRSSSDTFHRSLSVAETRRSVKKNREESGSERNRSIRYSPGSFENGLLRLHLTPSWSRRRKSGRSLMNSRSIARSVL